jgi:hypothetical protein
MAFEKFSPSVANEKKENSLPLKKIDKWKFSPTKSCVVFSAR